MYFNPNEMKIALCKTCKGVGQVTAGEHNKDKSIFEADTLVTCPACTGYGRVVNHSVKATYTFDQFEELKETKE